MKLSQTNGPAFVFYDTHEQTIEHLHRCGFKCVDISFFTRFTQGSIYFSDDYLKVVDEYLEAFKRYDMQPVQCHESASNNMGDDNGEYYHKKAARAIEMASKIGCPSMTIHPGKLKTLMTREEFVEKNIESISRMIPRIEYYGLTLLLENIETVNNNYFATSADDLIQIIDGIGHPLIQACWDVGHANVNGLNQYDEIKKLGKRLKGLHIHDNFGPVKNSVINDFHISDMHIPPFFGNIDYNEIMKALLETGYTGTFNFEVNPPKRPSVISNDGSAKLLKLDKQLLISSDTYVYEAGKNILEAYGCYEY
jgi:sugar phosphate isomerase/epimerase